MVTEGTGPVLENPQLGKRHEEMVTVQDKKAHRERTDSCGITGLSDRLASFPGRLCLRAPSLEHLRPEASEPLPSFIPLSVRPQLQAGSIAFRTDSALVRFLTFPPLSPWPCHLCLQWVLQVPRHGSSVPLFSSLPE